LAIGDFLVIRDTLQPADLIHVISGEDYRTDHAIQLYKLGYGRRIFFTGVGASFMAITMGSMGPNWQRRRGVESQDIAIDESEVTSTHAEVVLVKEFIARNPTTVRSVIVFSDPHHMRRVRWTYQKMLGDEFRVELAPVPFEATPSGMIREDNEP